MIMAGAVVANVSEPLVLYRVAAGAYERRGGVRLLWAEIRLQHVFLVSGFTTLGQFLRNVLRGGYRLVPAGLRRVVYRRVVAQRGGRLEAAAAQATALAR